jgi:hypothetical protein
VRWNIALLSVRTEEDEEEEAQIMILDSSVYLSNPDESMKQPDSHVE